jgi:transposase-like protein
MGKVTAEEKAMWVEDWKASGQSAWKYAKDNKLNTQTFSNWVKAAAAETGTGEEAGGFVEVTGKAKKIKGGKRKGRKIIIECGGLRAWIPESAGAEKIRAVIAGMRGPA